MKRNDGFTLLEIIIYIGMFAAALSFVMVIFAQIIDSQDQNREWIEVEEEANFLMRKIQWALSGVQTMNEPLVGSTSSVLSVSKWSGAENPLVFSVSAGTALLSRSGGSAEALTASTVDVDALTFHGIPAQSGGTEAVDVSLHVSSRLVAGGVQASTTLVNRFYLRR